MKSKYKGIFFIILSAFFICSLWNATSICSVILKSENQGPTTGWENVDVGKDQSIKFIHQDRLYILRNGIIYDTTGQQIQTINK